MAKKKKQFPNRGRNMVIGTVIALVVVLFTGGAIAAKVLSDIKENSYVSTINGEKLNVGEFKLNLFQTQYSFENDYGQSVWTWDLGDGYTALDYAKETAYSNTLYSKLVAIMAKEYGVATTTEEQEAEVEETLEMFHMVYQKELLGYFGLSDNELRQVFRESYYSENVYTKITNEGYIFNEEDFETSFEAYFESEYNHLSTYVLNYIITDSEAAITEALERYENGEDFMALVAEYSYDYYAPDEVEDNELNDDEESYLPNEDEITDETETEETETDDTDITDDETNNEEFVDLEELGLVIDMSDYNFDMNEYVMYGDELPADIADAVFALEPGQITEIIPLWNDDYTAYSDYIILRLITSEGPSRETEREAFRDDYTTSAKNEYFNAVFDDWCQTVDIQHNDKAIAAVKLYGY